MNEKRKGKKKVFVRSKKGIEWRRKMMQRGKKVFFSFYFYMNFLIHLIIKMPSGIKIMLKELIIHGQRATSYKLQLHVFGV